MTITNGLPIAVSGAVCAAATALAASFLSQQKRAPVASDVDFLLSRAHALQQAKGQKGPISLELVMMAMQETGASKIAVGGVPPPPAAAPLGDNLTKKELEETMKQMLGPPGGMAADESALERFTTDLTQSARYGKLDPVIGRDEEIRRCVHILSRRTKNSPVLIGECGVGKTAIVEALAHRIVAGDVPMALMNVKIHELDLGSLTAGCMMPGEFEERLKAVLNEMAALGNRAILFIDDIHNLVPAMGGQGGSMMDGGALLKPALSRGELRCIGCSGIDKFKKTIEKDAALERRFQQVFVAQPSVEQTVSILRGLRQRYEGYHGADISEAALVASASMAARYIQGRYLPDKAIDLMDEATAQVKMEITLKPEALDVIDRLVGQLENEERFLKRRAGTDKVAADHLSEIELKLLELKDQRSVIVGAQEKSAPTNKVEVQGMLKISHEIDSLNADADEADEEGNAIEASEMRTRASVLEGDLQDMRRAAMNTSAFKAMQKRAEVQEADIAKVISRWTGIPVTKLVASEKARLLHLTDELHKRIIGQEEAVEAVAEAIQRSRADLVDPNGPISSFMFLGPTGVGKTELAKALAANMFNSEDALVRLDMSEYMEKHAVSRLIGAPPGYVGYDEGGLLTDAVRRRPYSVVLFDEIEKAHVDVFNILLQILDDGRVTDTQGHTVSFKNTLIIMTSNLGSAEIFALPEAEKGKDMLKEKVMEHVRDHFRPEFINRVDDFITFLPLKMEQIHQIVLLRAERLVSSMADKRMHLQLLPSAVQRIAEVGYDPIYGARPVKRALQRELQTLLAKALLRGDFEEDDSVIVEAASGPTGLTLTKGPKVENPATVRVAELKAKAQAAADAMVAAARATKEAKEREQKELVGLVGAETNGSGISNGIVHGDANEEDIIKPALSWVGNGNGNGNMSAPSN